jgi:hypothetical protein
MLLSHGNGFSGMDIFTNIVFFNFFDIYFVFGEIAENRRKREREREREGDRKREGK